jgi:hypothetical protein
MKAQLVVFLTATLGLSGCYTAPTAPLAPEPQYQMSRIIKLSAVGYGSPNTYERYTEGQKRLMAMRASKLDAYRSMAEQVYGVRVTGGSTVGAMVLQNDNFRVSIDAYVRGARVTNVTQMADGNYETTIEMDFDDSVVRSYAVAVPVRPVAVPVQAPNYVRGSVGPGSAYGATYYYAE